MINENLTMWILCSLLFIIHIILIMIQDTLQTFKKVFINIFIKIIQDIVIS